MSTFRLKCHLYRLLWASDLRIWLQYPGARPYIHKTHARLRTIPLALMGQLMHHPTPRPS